MEFETIFLVALQSSLFLGLIHGINPCGHSWLILAPFIYGEKKGGRVFSLTSAFIMGTTLACLVIGFTLGSISLTIPASLTYVVDVITVCVLVALGAVLIIKPELLHGHDHDPDQGHDHEHSHNHDPDHHHGHEHDCQCGNHHSESKSAIRSVTFWGLFSVGFFNMVVPCPTVAIMYSYALDSGSVLKGTAVFASYALGTAIALSVVIYAIYKAAGFVRTLEQGWVEPLVMRTAGVMTIAFGIYSYTTM
ncbi:sulfite exporter TauE/SafE family protein [Maridesulfovibrio ferrireducens]|uniref:urease accessory protein UreH domain-containing protein n=1 Tax=Maridesulfovibrio ferrireducens TaxID=246191 RepID=UPI001A1C30AE|nr:sulfite exporter TauE/SafE family protein [Maridesulfovibrio ferrireducens]MBI9111831.1 sulfite exporter TauE/SafE family protein [Maridesulfovibrio ferrireducens]